MTNEQRSSTARALLVAGAALVLAAGFVETFGVAFGAMLAPSVITIPAYGTPGTPGYSPESSVTLAPNFYLVLGAWLLVWSVGPAIALFWSAARTRREHDAGTAGAVAIVAGALSLLSGGGFVAGAALGILGGALALRGSGPTTGAPPARPA